MRRMNGQGSGRGAVGGAAVCLMALAILCAPPAARAAPTLRLGGDYLLDGGPGLFSLTLGGGTPRAPPAPVGVRAGGLVTTSPTTGAVPIDVALRLSTGRVYFE